MIFRNHHHLAYCTNIHPAETWTETFQVLQTDVLAVRDSLQSQPTPSRTARTSSSFAIGLRLSALAAEQLLQDDNLTQFRTWLHSNNCYVFTINGFPYGAFHHTSVKENVYRPDWTTPERLAYTNNLFTIINTLCPPDSGGSVSTLPGSFKEFKADETLIFQNLYHCAEHIHQLAQESGKDLHLGLEPEPIGHFENTDETLAFFDRFLNWAQTNTHDPQLIKQHIGINYDTCHFALEFDDCRTSLQKLTNAGLRISKIHLSNALSFNPKNPEALEAIKKFNEPTYLHQVILNTSPLTRFKDLPQFFESLEASTLNLETSTEGRIHFHIPLYSAPLSPLASTLSHAQEALQLLEENPDLCPHLEIETYTWGVLPDNLQKPLTEQITAEYQWVFNQPSTHTK